MQVTMAGGAPGVPGARGGGIARVAATDLRAITDFDAIAVILFTFARHPMYPEVHVHMNSIFEDAFLDVDDLFTVTAPPSRVNFVAHPATIIKNKMRDESIASNAVDTADPTAITPLWARCSFLVTAGARHSTRRLTPATLKEALQHTIVYANLHELRISIQALHFWLGLSYLEWGNGITDSPTALAAAAAAAPAPAAVAPAPAPGSAPPTSTDIATAVAIAVTAAMSSAPAPANTLLALFAPSATCLRTSMLFNPSSLPRDVRTRYNHKQNGKILTAVIHTPFNCPGDACHSLHYWIDPGLEKTTCADGSIFFHVPIDEKLVMKHPMPCIKDSHAAVRRWCQTFQETMM